MYNLVFYKTRFRTPGGAEEMTCAEVLYFL